MKNDINTDMHLNRLKYVRVVAWSFCLFILSTLICTTDASTISVDDFFADVDKVKTKSSAEKLPAPASIYDAGDTLKTLTGEVYKNYKVTRTEPDGITFNHSKGIAKVFFTELPPEFANHYNYNPSEASAYATEMAEKRSKLANQRQQAAKQAAADDTSNVRHFENRQFTCPDCNGRGETKSKLWRSDGRVSYTPCARCRRSGKITKKVEVKPNPSKIKSNTSNSSGTMIQLSAYGSKSARFKNIDEAYAYRDQVNDHNEGAMGAVREASINGSLASGTHPVDTAQYRVAEKDEQGYYWVIPK